MEKSELTVEALRRLFEYRPETGEFVRLVDTYRQHNKGSIAGSLMTNGYWEISIRGVRYYAHRLAWFYMTGEWPKTIDHKDGDRINNRFGNLRSDTQGFNVQNQRRAASTNKYSGLLGVSPVKNSPKWRARIGVDGSSTHLGCFDTKELAHAAYVEAKRELHAGCTL